MTPLSSARSLEESGGRSASDLILFSLKTSLFAGMGLLAVNKLLAACSHMSFASASKLPSRHCFTYRLVCFGQGLLATLIKPQEPACAKAGIRPSSPQKTSALPLASK